MLSPACKILFLNAPITEGALFSEHYTKLPSANLGRQRILKTRLEIRFQPSFLSIPNAAYFCLPLVICNKMLKFLFYMCHGIKTGLLVLSYILPYILRLMMLVLKTN